MRSPRAKSDFGSAAVRIVAEQKPSHKPAQLSKTRSSMKTSWLNRNDQFMIVTDVMRPQESKLGNSFMNPRYAIADTSNIFSPALIFYKDLIRHNIAELLHIAGSAERLRPHVKTHKTREIVRLQL